ncbi:MAG: FAD-dependent oxidoreductase [Parvibaculaceae bacterium]|nr:FAD-dependent oxidoreductase [Parvibaculaceae bacterium]
MTQTIAVIGAGIAGLATGLALQQEGREVILIDRDAPPPTSEDQSDADLAFNEWQRKGVTHLRHSHAFLARLYKLIRDDYPDLLKALLDAGCRELTFADMLPPNLAENYVPEVEDKDFTILSSRRSTFEYVIRKYVTAQAGIRLLTETQVTGLTTSRTPDGTLILTGVDTQTSDGENVHINTDAVVDAGGRLSFAQKWLETEGVNLAAPELPTGIVYYTRHYRLLPGQSEPERTETPAAGDLGYLKFGIFPADNNHYSITLAVPEAEEELRKAIIQPDVFDAACRAIAGLKPWIDPARAEGVSRVFGMGQLFARWRDLLPNGKPALLNFFPIGDAYVRTNPLYGRGCSFAFVEAEGLKRALNDHTDPAKRLASYVAYAEKEVRPYYNNMLKQDAQAIKDSKALLTPHAKSSLRGKIVKSFVQDAMIIAMRSDITLFRDFVRGFHMIAPSDDWIKNPRAVTKIMWTWMRGKQRNAALYPPKAGPKRAEMFSHLALSADVDISRTAEKAQSH